MNAEQLPAELRRVHMVGIGGAGMSGIARILLDRGALVSGSDAKESRGLHALRARGARIRVGHDESALDLLERKPATPESQQVQITAPEPSPAVVHPESFIVAGATPAARAAVSVGLTVVLTWSLCLL